MYYFNSKLKIDLYFEISIIIIESNKMDMTTKKINKHYNEKNELEYELENLIAEYRKARGKAYREIDNFLPINYNLHFGTKKSIDFNNERDHEIERFINSETFHYHKKIFNLRKKVISKKVISDDDEKKNIISKSNN